jgi:L-serine dehydratase
MKFTTLANGKEHVATFYSIGGGFVVKRTRECQEENRNKTCFSIPTDKAVDVLATVPPKTISEIVYENEKSIRTSD